MRTCHEFFDKLVKSMSPTDVKVKTAMGELSSEKLCSTHESFRNCIESFHEKYEDSNRNRNIKDIIEDYTPNNELLRKALGK